MRKLGIVAVVAATVLLAGCATGGTAEESAPAAETQRTAPAVEPTSAPITMEPTEEAAPVDPSQDFGDYTPDEFYLLATTSAWRGEVPDDASLIGAAKLACDSIAAGSSDVVVVSGEGEDATWNNSLVIQGATQVYCPPAG